MTTKINNDATPLTSIPSMALGDGDRLPTSPASAGKNSVSIGFSPLMDRNNKLTVETTSDMSSLFSPQTELVTKLELTSLSGTSSNPVGSKEFQSENHRPDISDNVCEVTVPNNKGKQFISSSKLFDEDNFSLKKNQYSGEYKVAEAVDTSLPDHYQALINSSLPSFSDLKQTITERNLLKRGAADCITMPSWHTTKKPKCPLDAIKENCSLLNGNCRSRSDSDPTPGVKDITKLSVESITPRRCWNSGESLDSVGSCTTPIRAGSKSKSSRKLQVSRSFSSITSSSSDFNSPLSSQKNLIPSKLATTSSSVPLTDYPCPLLIGDMSKKCLLTCRLFDGVPLVECDEIAKLLEGHYINDVECVFVVDCRFPYEYEGGHIRGAVNFPHPFFEKLKASFFGKNDNQNDKAAWLRKGDQIPASTWEASRVIVIFHCEFSSHRAPNTFRWFRTEDRNSQTVANYPKLDYPEAYVLSGGYKAFVKYCNRTGKSNLCEPPGGYTEQWDPRYRDHLRRLQRRIKTMSDVEDYLKSINIENANVSVSKDDQKTDIMEKQHRSESIAICDQAAEFNCSEDSDHTCESEFDDDEFCRVKIQWLQKEMARRRSECPLRQRSSIGRASFEELSPLTGNLEKPSNS